MRLITFLVLIISLAACSKNQRNEEFPVIDSVRNEEALIEEDQSKDEIIEQKETIKIEYPSNSIIISGNELNDSSVDYMEIIEIPVYGFEDEPEDFSKYDPYSLHYSVFSGFCLVNIDDSITNLEISMSNGIDSFKKIIKLTDYELRINESPVYLEEITYISVKYIKLRFNKLPPFDNYKWDYTISDYSNGKTLGKGVITLNTDMRIAIYDSYQDNPLEWPVDEDREKRYISVSRNLSKNIYIVLYEKIDNKLIPVYCGKYYNDTSDLKEIIFSDNFRTGWYYIVASEAIKKINYGYVAFTGDLIKIE